MAPLQGMLSDCTEMNWEDKDYVDAKSETLNRKYEILWINVIFFMLLHVGGFYGLYILLFKATWLTFIYFEVYGHIAALGITAGAHRLWSHKSYKARLPLEIILVYLNTMSGQSSVITWARYHRLHHKYSDTDADPHNSKRGFFYAHIGWLLVKQDPVVIAKGKDIDLSDLTSNPLLRFQKRYYAILALLACFVIPSYIPTLWDESLWNSFFACGVYRYIRSFHTTCLVNSAAHLWGEQKPYDKNLNPVESKTVSLLALGEGFHNYHHTFPWDYKTAELGNYTFNPTTMFIDAMAKIGWAYDLKTVSQDVINKRAERTGDGSHQGNK